MTELEEYNKRHPVRRNPDTGVVTDHRTGEQKAGFFTRVKQSIKEKQTERSEERRIADAARREGRREGIKKGARAKGIEEGEQAARYGTGISGFIRRASAPKTHTVTTTRYVGKGKHKQKVVTRREVREKGSGGGSGIGFAPLTAGGMESAFGMGGGSKKESDPFSMDFGSGLTTGWESEARPKKGKKKDPFGF